MQFSLINSELKCFIFRRPETMVQWGNYFTPRVRKLGAICAATFFVGYGVNFAMYRFTQSKFCLFLYMLENWVYTVSRKFASKLFDSASFLIQKRQTGSKA